MELRTLGPDIRTAACAAMAAKHACDKYGRVTMDQAHGLALIVEQKCMRVYGGKDPAKSAKRAMWREAKAAGLIPSGILFWLVRIILMRILERLVEHWLYSDGRWS